jgi:hypothetical protein
MSPKSKRVVVGIGGILPDPLERALCQLAGRPDQIPFVRASLEEIDEILDLGNPFGR